MRYFLLILTLLLASCSPTSDFEIYEVWQENQATFIEFSFEAPYAQEYIVFKDGEAIQNGTVIFSPLILWFLPDGELEIKMRRLGVGTWQVAEVN